MFCLLLSLFLQVSVISTAPLLQWLQRNQLPIQQRLLELQAMQYYPMSPIGIDTMNIQPQPLIIILPDDQIKSNTLTNIDSNNENQHERIDRLKTKMKEEDDSVIIDAAPIPTIDDRKAIVVIPSGRFSIGDFISAIPFLPIEINVPDTVSWIGNGISGIISGIGQRFPFLRPSPNLAEKPDINNIQLNSQFNPNIMNPIMMLPLGANRHILPIQL